jgi:hypothetical protein
MVTPRARVCVSAGDAPRGFPSSRTLAVNAAKRTGNSMLSYGQGASVRKLSLLHGVSPADTHARGGVW